MKILKIKETIVVVFNDGTTLSKTDCNETLYNTILENSENEEEVKKLLLPEFYSKKKEYDLTLNLFNIPESSCLKMLNESVYMQEVCDISLPKDLALKILEAEKNNDEKLLKSYKNFWILCSLNPDSRARENMFWFLEKYGMKISESGLFVAYRNVCIKNNGSNMSFDLAKYVSKQYVKLKFKKYKNPEDYIVCMNEEEKYYLINQKNNVDAIFYDSLKSLGNLAELYENLSKTEEGPVFTDGYTKTFSIKLGEPVVMKRSLCDSNQENTCSKGLHLGGKSWLESQGLSYFGSTTIMCLVNPADVVAVPRKDDYGKMRVCSYYPVKIVERKDNKIVEEDIDGSFIDDFINIIKYDGTVNNQEKNIYKIHIPESPEINSKKVYKNLNKISEELSHKRV